ncbi:unnamed protein product [Ceutorhynchus assimilis]|uniref:Uncharacterized protein n=1 Tax=Ceutorhynchus assimilis TaxID=467358 RepID=A0A9N9MN70_9CUCU|nr:unnamed protein product [Ceutorhynchus assimilis]
MEFYWVAADIEKAKVEKQRAILLHLLDDYGLEIYNTLSFAEKDDELTLEGIVCGITNDIFREKLLSMRDLDLSKCIDICRADEGSRKQVRAMSGTSSNSDNSGIDRLNIFNKYEAKDPNFKKYLTNDKKCYRCNSSHDFGNCPAWGKICGKCKNRNHFSSCCKVKKLYEVKEKNNENQEEQKSQIDKDEQEYKEVLVLDIITEKYFFNIAEIEAKSVKDWTEKVCINETFFMEFGLDSGSEANILPIIFIIITFNKLNNKPAIKKNNKSLLVYNKKKLNVLGVCRLSARFNDVKMDFDFYILEENYEPILGLNSCMQLNLMKRVSCIVHRKYEGRQKFCSKNN